MAPATFSVSPPHRNFGHCIVLWKIKNFSLAVSKSGTKIECREFTVSSLKVTRWKVCLHIVSDISNIHVVLSRLDEIDEKFRVSWRLSILNNKNEGISFPDNHSLFAKNSFHLVNSIPTLDIIKLLPASEPDDLHLKFQMIVFMNVDLLLQNDTEMELRRLAEDMAVVCREGLHSDIIAMVNDQNLKVHRAMLCPRSNKLAELAGHEHRKKFKLHFDDIEAVKNLFSYLYSGSLEYILDPPSISIYEYITTLDIKELKGSYPEEKYTMETIIGAKNFEFLWIIKEFYNEEPQDSEIYEADNMDLTWKLRLYSKGLSTGTDMQKKHVYIEALAIRCEETRYVYLDFKVTEKSGSVIISKRTHGKISCGKKLGISLMRIDGCSMSKAVIDNTLNLSFSVHIATENISTEKKKIQSPVLFHLNNDHTYKILASYLGRLQTCNSYSDVTLLVQNCEFKAHKFLLAGRSVYFSRMLEKVTNDDLSFTLNTDKRLFRVFLDFLYTSMVTDVNIKFLMNLYELSFQYEVKSLREPCERHLRNQVISENCVQMLLFADARRLASLKTEALQTMAANRNTVFMTDDWIAFQMSNSPLFYDVLQFLANTPVETPWALVDDISLHQDPDEAPDASSSPQRGNKKPGRF